MENKRYMFAIVLLEVIIIMVIAFHLIALEKRIRYTEGKINCLMSIMDHNKTLKDVSIACATINTGY